MTSTPAAGERWADFHGLLVRCAYRRFAGDGFTPLFDEFAVDPARDAERALLLELRATSERERPPDSSGWTPTFCYGRAQGYSAPGKHRLSDGKSWIDVDAARSRLSGVLFEPERSNITSGMQHVALSLLLRGTGAFELHAAGAWSEDRAFVVLGDAGAGKTSTLLALLSAGAEYMGDDRLLLRALGGAIELLAYPREFHISARTLEFHPQLSADDVRPWIDGKVRLNPIRSWPGRLRRRFSGPTVLLAPRIVECSTTSIRRLSGAEAFGALLTSSATVAVEALPHRTAQLALLTQLANEASAFELLLGRDFLTAPARAASLLLASLSHHHV